jgi:hypothetical protein
MRYNAASFPAFRNVHHLKFIVQGAGQWRILIDCKDYPRYDAEGLEWCDLYAKVNVDPGVSAAPFDHKLLAIGPNFPVRLENLLGTAYMAAKTCVAAFMERGTRQALLRSPVMRAHFAGWYGQWRHAHPEAEYQPAEADSNYAFFSASLWKEFPLCNKARADFMKACQSIDGLNFEGGFSPRSKADVAGFENATLHRRYSHTEFFAKAKRSVVAFNNPAVADCHSWRLGEYLALGKAIVSTELKRALPAPFRHGEEVHFAEAQADALQKAIIRIMQDENYRKRLEQNARAYYVRYLRPSAVIQRIWEAVKQRNCSSHHSRAVAVSR